MTQRTTALRLLAPLTLIVTLAGCQQPNVAISPIERDELRARAIDLLTRAAGSDVDLLMCNAMEALSAVAPDDGRPYFRAALRHPTVLVRVAGCRAIGDVQDRGALPAIHPLLRDQNPLVRLAAAYAAYRLGDQAQAAVLVHALEKAPDEQIRAEAAYLIGKLGDPAARKRLQYILHRGEESARVRVHLYAALALLGDEPATDELIYYAQGDASSRIIALQFLAELGTPRVVEALRYRLGPAEDYLEHRLVAARGLGRCGLADGYDLAMQSTRYIGENPQDPDETPRVRALAALALGAIGRPDALPRLRDLAAESTDERVQVAACYAICEITGR